MKTKKNKKTGKYEIIFKESDESEYSSSSYSTDSEEY